MCIYLPILYIFKGFFHNQYKIDYGFFLCFNNVGDISALKQPQLESIRKNALFLALESVRNEMRHQKRERRESEDYDDVRHLSLKKSVCDKSSLRAEKRALFWMEEPR